MSKRLSDFTPASTITNANSYFHFINEDEIDDSDKNQTITYANLLAKIILDAGLGTGAQDQITPNRETIIGNKILVSTDPVRHHLFTETPGLTVTLPTSAPAGTSFLIKNNQFSTQNFTVIEGVDTIILTPGDIYEAFYDGVVWVEI